MIPTSEQLLDAIAGQARTAYATTQLAVCQAAFHLWQQRAEQPSGEFPPERVQYELAYHIQQMDRWQQYLAELGPGQRIIQSSEAAE